MTLWDGILWMHLLGMAFFVGGQMMLAGVVVPVLRRLDDRGPLLAAIQRFGIGTGIAFIVLIASGAALASHEHRWSDSTLHVKMALVAVVAILIGVHTRLPHSPVIDVAIFAVSVAIVWLGIVVGG